MTSIMFEAAGPIKSVMDDPSDTYPDRRHAWVTVAASEAYDAPSLTLSFSYGLATDEEIVNRTSALIDALATLRDAAIERLADADVEDPNCPCGGVGSQGHRDGCPAGEAVSA